MSIKSYGIVNKYTRHERSVYSKLQKIAEKNRIYRRESANAVFERCLFTLICIDSVNSQLKYKQPFYVNNKLFLNFMEMQRTKSTRLRCLTSTRVTLKEQTKKAWFSEQHTEQRCRVDIAETEPTQVRGQGSAEGLPSALTPAPKDGSVGWASGAAPLLPHYWRKDFRIVLVLVSVPNIILEQIS